MGCGGSASSNDQSESQDNKKEEQENTNQGKKSVNPKGSSKKGGAEPGAKRKPRDNVSKVVTLFHNLANAVDDVADAFYAELNACALGKSSSGGSSIPEDTIEFASGRLKHFSTKFVEFQKQQGGGSGAPIDLLTDILECYQNEQVAKLWKGVQCLLLCIDLVSIGYVVAVRSQLLEAEVGDRSFTDISEGSLPEEEEDLVRLHSRFIGNCCNALQTVFGGGPAIPQEFMATVRQGGKGNGSFAGANGTGVSSHAPTHLYYLESVSLTTMVSLVMLEVIRPSAGMHTVSSMKAEVKALNEQLKVLGFADKKLLPPSKANNDGGDDEDDDEDNSSGATASAIKLTIAASVCLLGPPGRKALLYLEAAVNGQKKLPLASVVRSDVIKSTWKLVNAYDEAPTFKLFPTFVNSSCGVERGEGHGPRKEYYDITAKELTATYSDPVDISDCFLNCMLGGANTKATSTMSLRKKKSTISFKWKNKEAAEFASLKPGVDLEIRCVDPTSGNASLNMSTRWANEPANLGGAEEFTCRRTISAVNHNGDTTTIELSGALEGMIIEEVEGDSQSGGSGGMVDSTVELADLDELSFIILRKVVPLFSASQDVTQYCWINPSLPPSMGDGAAESVTYLQKFKAVGTVVANAVSNGVELPATLPPLLFHLTTLKTPKEDLLRWNCSAEDIALMSNKANTTTSIGSPVASNHQQAPSGAGDLGEDPEYAPILAMDTEEFATFLEYEDLDALGISEAEKQKLTPGQYIHDVLVPSRVFPGPGSSSREYLAAFVEGFQRSKIHLASGYASATPELRRHIICGLRDDGVSDFRFQDHFRFNVGDDMKATPHGKKLRKIFFDLIETEFDVNEKRQLLQFITGRTLLPSNKGEETINVEFPYSCMGARDFARTKHHLPASHSCDNVIDLPNYLECIIFEPQSSWYEAAGMKVGGMIGESVKRGAWSQLPQDTQQDFLIDCRTMLKEKLLLAVQNSSGYELDEGIAAANGSSSDIGGGSGSETGVGALSRGGSSSGSRPGSQSQMHPMGLGALGMGSPRSWATINRASSRQGARLGGASGGSGSGLGSARRGSGQPQRRLLTPISGKKTGAADRPPGLPHSPRKPGSSSGLHPAPPGGQAVEFGSSRGSSATGSPPPQGLGGRSSSVDTMPNSGRSNSNSGLPPRPPSSNMSSSPAHHSSPPHHHQQRGGSVTATTPRADLDKLMDEFGYE